MDFKKILTDIARAIVDTPDAVVVEETVNGDDIELVLTVAEDEGIKDGGEKQKKKFLTILSISSLPKKDISKRSPSNPCAETTSRSARRATRSSTSLTARTPIRWSS